MDSGYGGAKPKVKTPAKSTTLNEDKKRDKKTRNLQNDQHSSLGCANNTPSFLQDQHSSDCEPFYFVEDHFDDKFVTSIPRRAHENNTKELSQKRVKNAKRDKQFVKEFLPLTDELIENAIKALPRAIDGTQIAQSSSSSTDFECADVGDLAEIVECKKRKKELSPRDKWKRSGYALRKYLANKFGFRSSSKQTQESHQACMNCLPSDSVGKHQYRQIEVNPNVFHKQNQQNKSRIDQVDGVASSDVLEDKKENSPSFSDVKVLKKVKVDPNDIHEAHQQLESGLMTQLNDNANLDEIKTANAQSLLSKILSRRKGKCKQLTKQSLSAESSTTTDESSSVSPNSPLQDVDQSDLSRHSNSNPTNQEANRLDLANQTARTCLHDSFNKVNHEKAMKCASRKKSHDDLDSKTCVNLPPKLCRNSSPNADKKGHKLRKGDKSKPGQTKKKSLVGVFDAEIGTSSDSENDSTKLRIDIKRRKRRSAFKDTVDAELKLYNTDNSGQRRNFPVVESPKGTKKHLEQPTAKQNTTSERRSKPKDVLHGLKYALPYLPERSRNRLHSYHSDDNNVKTKSILPNTKSVRPNTKENNVQKLHSIHSDDNNDKTRLVQAFMKENNVQNILDDSIQLTDDQKVAKTEIDIQNNINEDTHHFQSKCIQSGARSDQVDMPDNAIRTRQDIAAYSDYINRLRVNQCSGNDENIKVGQQTSKTVDEIHKCDFETDIYDSEIETESRKEIENVDEELFDGHNKDDSDINFHLNESGTWTVTGLDEKIDQELKGGNNKLWYPFNSRIGPLRRDSYTDWVEQDLMQLEASLEDPFNLRGDNLTMNESSLKGDNSFNDCDSDEEFFKTGTEASPIGSNESISDRKLTMCDGLMDLVNGIDEPFINEEPVEMDKEKNDTELSSYKSSFWDTWRRHRDFLEAYDSDSQNSSQEGRSTMSLEPSGSNSQLVSNGSKVKKECESTPKGGYTQDAFQGSLLGLSVLDEDVMGLTRTPEIKGSIGLLTHEIKESKLKNESFNSDKSFHTMTPHSSFEVSDHDCDSDTGAWRFLQPDADDEFECDCEHCITSRQRHMGSGSEFGQQFSLPPRLTPLTNNYVDEDDYFGTDNLRLNEGNLEVGLQINISNETSMGLGIGIMLENVILQLLTDNVIMQMIAVQPDLLTDQAPPPATQSIIDKIPTINLSQQDIDQNPVCPVCLCPCNLGESMSRLPCQHIFHPICVQAWLVKSGTCPVCRYRMES